jgi:hypothetical protein
MPLLARHYLAIKLYLRRTLVRLVHNPAKEPQNMILVLIKWVHAIFSSY